MIGKGAIRSGASIVAHGATVGDADHLAAVTMVQKMGQQRKGYPQ